MDNLKAALGWFDLGLRPFPCYEKDEWQGDTLRLRKSPRTKRGFYDAFDSRAQIENYWLEHPEHLVGVWCGERLVVLDIDIDKDDGRDGQFALDENGVDVPKTFSVRTHSGGEHRFYLNSTGAPLGPASNIVLENGLVLPGVDRRAGSSYFIAWSDEVPQSLEELAPAPAWLLRPHSSSSLSAHDGSLSEWFESLPQGHPTPRVRDFVDRILAVPDSKFGHDAMRDRQFELVQLAVEGHTGVLQALFALKERWLRPPWDKAKYEVDWEKSLIGAIKKFGALAARENGESEDELFAAAVRKRTWDKRVEIESDARLLAEGYSGTTLLTFDELRNLQRDYLVQDFVPLFKGLTVMVAKPNMGKTFAYIDMVCRMVFNMEWMGKKTSRTKTLLVLGEGTHGYMDRLEAWCTKHSKPVAEVENWVHIVDGANLSNSASLERLSALVGELSIGFIVLDTWAATSGVPDEDKAAVTSIALNKLRETVDQASILLIHHPNKSSEDSTRPVARGSSALEGRADVVMTIVEDKKYKSKSGMSREWKMLSTESKHGGKNRGAKQESIRGAYLESFSDSAVWAVDTSSLVRPGTALVQEHLTGPMSIQDFVAKTGKSPSTAGRYLQDAVADGVVIKVKSKAANQPDIFEPTMSELSRRSGY